MKLSFSLPAVLKITSAKSGLSHQRENPVYPGDKTVSSLLEFQLVSFTEKL